MAGLPLRLRRLLGSRPGGGEDPPVTPNAPPDAFLDATPADALQHLADPEHTSKAIAQLRHQLQETSPTCPAPAPSPAPDEPGPRDDAEQVAADRAMLAQTMAVARRRQDRQEWTARQRAGEHAADVPHALDGFTIGERVGQEWTTVSRPTTSGDTGELHERAVLLLAWRQVGPRSGRAWWCGGDDLDGVGRDPHQARQVGALRPAQPGPGGGPAEPV
nr:hypothetical protein [Nonomuraea diastatica]